MGKRYRIILFLFFTANMVFAESNLDSLLVNLDQTILQHEIYKDRREARIRELKGKATKTAPNSIAAYQLNDSIYREYKSYMCDSAVLYLTKNIRIARNLRDQEREYKSKLLLASLHAATGMYQEAIDVLEEVRREDLPASLARDYYACKEQVYREISGNSRDPQSIRRYEDKSFVYRDSLAMMLPEDAGKRVELQELALRADALSEAAKADGYKSAVESLSRAFNLAEKADASVTVDASLFENDQEKALAKAIEELELTGSASDKLAQLFALSPVIDAFFDNTMVMAEDEAVKNNRLALLAGLVAKANAVAAFNQLNTK